MSTPRCIAASLTLHASLVVFAVRGSALQLEPAGGKRALDTAIAVETLETLGGAAPGAAAASSPSAPVAVAPPAPATVAPTPRPRERAQRPPPVAAPAPAASAPALPREPSTSAPAAAAPETSAVAPAAAPASGALGATSGVARAVGSAGGSAGGSAAGVGSASPGRGNGQDGAARERLLARYLATVRARVAEHREYPYLARRANLEGTVCLRVSIGANGHLLGVAPTCGANARPLLAAALASVKEAAPFPPLPPALGPVLTLDVPIVFDLDSM